MADLPHSWWRHLYDKQHCHIMRGLVGALWGGLENIQRDNKNTNIALIYLIHLVEEENRFPSCLNLMAEYQDMRYVHYTSCNGNIEEPMLVLLFTGNHQAQK